MFAMQDPGFRVSRATFYIVALVRDCEEFVTLVGGSWQGVWCAEGGGGGEGGRKGRWQM